MTARWKHAILATLFLSLSVGVISLVFGLLTASPAGAATGCIQTAGTASITLDQAAGSPTMLSQDSSNNLLVNGAACGTGFPTEIAFVVTNGAPAQTVILDQTGAGGVFPCTTTIGGVMRSNDTVTVQAGSSENPVIGDTASGTGVDLNGCNAAGTFVGLGNWRLIGGSSTTVLSAAGEAGVMSGLDVRAVIEPGAGSETLVSGAATDAIDFSAVPTSGSVGLLVNLSGGPASESSGTVTSRTAVAGTSTYTFTGGSGGFNQYAGASTGFTTFLAPGTAGSTFIGQGSGDALDLGVAPTGTRIDASTSQVSGSSFGGTDSFTGFGTILGSAAGHTTFAGGSSPVTFVGRSGNNTFVAGTANENFQDGVSVLGDTVDFSVLTSPLTVNVSGQMIAGTANGTATSSTSTYSFASLNSPLTFTGASATTTFDAGTAADTYDGTSGQTNKLLFSNTTGSALQICGAAISGCTAGQAVLGSTQEPFANITSFTGLASGNTTFAIGASGGQSFTGLGAGDVLNGSAAPAQATVDASTAPGSVSGLSSGGSDSFSGISAFVGSAVGDTAFKAGGSSETFTNPSSTADSIDFSAVTTTPAALLSVNVSGGTVFSGGPLANKTASGGATTYSFSSGPFTSFTGATSGNTAFFAGVGGGNSFAGQGSGNSLDLGAAPTGVSADASAGQVTGLSAGGTDAFTGFGTVLGSTSGGTTFIGGAGPATFIGRSGNNSFVAGTGSASYQDSATAGDTVDFSDLTTATTVNVSGTTIGGTATNTATSGGSTYGFTGLNGPVSIAGAAANTVFDAGSIADTFAGIGTGSNTLSFANASGVQLRVCVVAGTGCSAANEAILGSTVIPFLNITSFTGIPTGNTTFVASGTGGYTFTGAATGNLLDLSAASSGAVDLADHTVTGLTGSGQDSFSGIQSFVVNLRINSTAPTGATVGQTYSPTIASTGSSAAPAITVDPSTTKDACSISGGTVDFVHSGSCVIDASQAGDATFAAAEAQPQNIVVGPAGTSTSVSVSPTAVVAKVTAATSATVFPTGTVSFTLGGASLGNPVGLTNGVAVLTATVPTGSARTVAATYTPGNGDFTGSLGSVNRSDPTIMAKATSAHPKTKFGWYRSKVTVSFTCHATSAPLAGSCPAAVSLSKKGAGQSVSRTVTATDGGAATAVVSAINIDLTKPTVTLTGVKSGHTYSTAPTIKVKAKDGLSGVASKKLSRKKSTKHGVTTVHYTETVKDKAGNVRTIKGTYRIT